MCRHITILNLTIHVPKGTICLYISTCVCHLITMALVYLSNHGNSQYVHVGIWYSVCVTMVTISQSEVWAVITGAPTLNNNQRAPTLHNEAGIV